jgi:hypothetical protein
MAKAIFPVRQLARAKGEASCQDLIVERFLRALGVATRPPESDPS